MAGISNPLHLVFIAAIALIFLGPKRLPELAKSLGHGMREFRDSLSTDHTDEGPHLPVAQAAAPAPVPAATPVPHAPTQPVPAPAPETEGAPAVPSPVPTPAAHSAPDAG